MEANYKRLIELLRSFVEGRRQSPDDVREIENEFAKHFDEDDRFADLQYELAMFGADDHPGTADLLKECKWALELLTGETARR